MKLINLAFSFLFFSVLFACSSSEPVAEEPIPESLSVPSSLSFSADQSSQLVNINANVSWQINNNSNWITVNPSSGNNNGIITVAVSANADPAERIGNLTITGGQLSRTLRITQAAAVQQATPPTGSLDPDRAPSENFDLSTWKLSIPINEGDGTATDISVSELNSGYENSSFFYTASDGGMVFKCPVAGYKTSLNTNYTRVELREMLRGTDTSISTQGVNQNNWVFGTAPQEDKNAAAAYDGEMNATLAVNHVTTTGNSSHIGRVIIGQIHANSDEPVRIYYRKLRDNNLGSIYFAHEPTDGNGSEQWHEMIGSRSNNANNPTDGIALDEIFSYRIKVVGDNLTVTIIRDGKPDVVNTINMANSGFNVGGQYMYFKAGVYHVNNSGNDDDYAQATFYALEKSHTTD